MIFFVLLFNLLRLRIIFRAIGTPLSWAEATKKADQVRLWGIKVRGDGVACQAGSYVNLDRSSYLRYGNELKVKSEMLCSGEMRYEEKA